MPSRKQNVINHDLAQHQGAEQARHESDEKWRSIFENSPGMYFVVDGAGIVIAVNPFGAEQLGYGAGDLTGRSVLQIIHEDDRDDAQRNTTKCIEELGKTMTWELRKLHKDGSVLWVRETARATILDGRPVVLVICHDITQAKRTEDELRRSEAYLADAQRLTHTGSWAWDPRSQRVLYCSDEMFRIFGLSRDLLPTRKRFRERVHPDDRARVDERFQRSLQDKVDSFDEYRIVLPDGTLKYICSLGHLVFDDSGTMVAFVGTAVDVTERKRAEEALRESEYKLRQIIDTVPGLIWSTGLDGEPTHISQRFLNYSGMPFEEFKHVGWKTFVHPDDFPDAAKDYDYAIQTGTSYQGVLRLRRADGEYRWHHARCEPLRDQHGRIIQWYGLSVDIAEDKKAEAQPGFVAQLQAILNVVPAYTWCAVPSGALTFVNKRTADYLGVPNDHPLRFGIDIGAQWDDWISLLHPDDREEARKYWSTCLRTGEGSEYSWRVRGAQGIYRWFLTRVEPLRASDGTLLRWIGVTLDIEELKRAEQALQESEHRLRQIIDTVPGLIWSIGPDGELTQINQGVLDYSGMPFEDHLGFHKFHHPDDLPDALSAFYQAMETGAFYQALSRLRRADGEYRWHQIRAQPLRDTEGRIVQWYGLSTDIDERMRAEQALQEEHERLRQLQSDLAHMNRLSMMGELAASLAHEIAQPIATARNNARASIHFLDRSPPELDQVSEALACIVDDADRAGNILDRIRDHIKKTPPRKEAVDLNRAITDVIALAQDAIVRSGVSIQTRLTEGLSDIQADRVQLQQVVLNLILNAVEAMGSIEVGVRELSITTTQHETGDVLVAVRDSGTGIDPEHIERVFDAFYTTKSGGMGMGLSICRSIIDAHGGRLWAESIEPTGTVFQFTLPTSEGTFTNAVPRSRQSEEPRGRTAPAAFRRRISEGNKRRHPSARGSGQRRLESP